MDASKFTKRSQEAINTAIQAAVAAGHAQVETWHLLDALLGQTDGIIHPLLQATGASPTTIGVAVDAELKKLPSASGSTVSSPSYARAAIQALQLSQDIAAELKDDFTSTELLLIAIAT